MKAYVKTRAYRGLSALLSLVLVSNVSAQCEGGENSAVPSTTPTVAFIDHSDGTVTDKTTGLMWKRCSEGQVFAGSTCTGTADGFDWGGALVVATSSSFAGHNDWRLPNIKELRSIVEQHCVFPPINADVFPNTPQDWFWSSSSYAPYGFYAWVVTFDAGGSQGANKGNHIKVRLVRSEVD